MIKIVWRQVEELASVFKRTSIEIDPLTDPQLYPSINDNKENVLRYFLVMVALDHRTQIPGYSYFSSKIGGKEFSGAFLLYRLGKIMYDNDSTFFSPERLVKITKKDVEKWLVSDTGVVRDPEVRAGLLKDLGYKLIKMYNGSVEDLIEQSNHRLKDDDGGLIDRLKIFRAYEDPVEKKSYLLAKFLIRRNLFHPIDLHNMQLPIDNHLTRIAIRTGIIESDDYTLFTNMREAIYEEDIIIRLQVRRAYKKISEISNHAPDKLDDYLWMHGKFICTYQNPKCDLCSLQSACLAYKNVERRKLQEHKYINTWYY